MKQHEQRVVDEKKELDEKIAALDAFLEGPVFPTLPNQDQDLLIDQVSTMDDYSDILARRIQRFETV